MLQNVASALLAPKRMQERGKVLYIPYVAFLAYLWSLDSARAEVSLTEIGVMAAVAVYTLWLYVQHERASWSVSNTTE